MHIDAVIIISVIVSCLVFFVLVAIFSVIFERKLGVKKRDGSHEGDTLLETTLSPVPLNEAQLEYSTTNVQPASKLIVSGYPHNQEMTDDDEDTLDEVVVDPEVPPKLTILLRYDRQRNFLLLKLLNMFDLPLRHDKTKVNSFIEVRLLPNFGQNPIQTDVYAGDSNPVLEETFEFEVDREELNSQKIEFVIMDARGYSNRSIGYVVMNMDSVNIGDLMAEKEVNAVLTIGKPKMQKSLSQSSLNEGADSGEEMQYTSPTAEGLSAAEGEQPRKTKGTVRLAKDWEYVAGMDPMILISLYYSSDTRKLVLAIIKVANLKTLPDDKMPDPYVKVHVYIRNKSKIKKKTEVKKQELNPVFNQKLEFSLLEKDLEHVKLVLIVKNQGPARGGSIRSRPSFLYEAILGESSTGSFLEHWKEAIKSSKPVAKWHILK